MSRKGVMTTNSAISRREVLSILENCGICGTSIFLIDLIPLIEMIWADGKVQSSEIAILNRFLQQHIKKINMVWGDGLLDLNTARDFCARFLEIRKTFWEFIGIADKVQLVENKISD